MEDLRPEADDARLRLNGIRHGYGGTRVLDSVSLDLRAGEVTCLLGPSGCGKSTLLRIAAGVERQDAGRVEVGGRPVSDGARHLPPEARGVGLMFQDFALFPHLSVERNVGFGLTGPLAGRARRVQQMLARVGLSRHAGKYPHQLSGGEQQRVALARALAPRPPILLMDEPFSGLDERLRDGIRDETLAILKEEGAAVLLVTHEPDEAMRMADEIALMREGRLVQQGRPYVIYNNPVDRAAAEFFSEVNVIRATVAATVAGAAAGTPFGRFDTPDLGEGAEVEIVVRPHHLRLDLDRNGRGPAPSAANGAAALGRVRRARFVGSESVVELALDQDGALLKATVPGVFLPRPGTPLWLSLRRDRCFVFPAPRH